MNVLLLRHGKTAYNDDSKERIRGWLNLPLTNEGIREAKEAAKKLEGIEIDKVFSSDLVRASKTADIITEHHRLKSPILDKRFRPWNLGDHQGKLVNKVKNDMIVLVKNPLQKAPNGESFHDFVQRYLGALKEKMEESVEKNHTYLIVAHYRNFAVAKAWHQRKMKGLLLHKDLIDGLDSDTGDIIRFKWDGENWNEAKN